MSWLWFLSVSSSAFQLVLSSVSELKYSLVFPLELRLVFELKCSSLFVLAWWWVSLFPSVSMLGLWLVLMSESRSRWRSR